MYGPQISYNHNYNYNNDETCMWKWNMNIGTWNVRSLSWSGAVKLLCNEQSVGF